MLKMVIESWKRQGMTHAEYIRYLTEVHAPMVKVYGHLLGFTRYVQNIKIESAAIVALQRRRGWTPAPDGAVALWFKSRAEMSTGMSSPEGREASRLLKDDEVQFIDPSKISAFLSEEDDLWGLPVGVLARSELVKMSMQIWRHPDGSLEEFEDQWSNRHAGELRRQAERLGIVRCVRSVRVPSAEIDGFARDRGWRQAPDGLLELWWANEGDFDKMLNSSGSSEIYDAIGKIEAEFTDVRRTTAFLSRENVVFDT